MTLKQDLRDICVKHGVSLTIDYHCRGHNMMSIMNHKDGYALDGWEMTDEIFDEGFDDFEVMVPWVKLKVQSIMDARNHRAEVRTLKAEIGSS